MPLKRIAVATLAAVLAQCFVAAQDQPVPPVKLPDQDSRIGDWVFAMPKGMKVVAATLDNMPALRPSGTPDMRTAEAVPRDSCEIKGEFRKWFDEQWEPVKREYTWANELAPQALATPKKYDLILAGGTGKHKHWLEDRFVIMAALHSASRAATLLFTTNDFDGAQAALAELDTVITTTTFAGLRGKEEPAPKLKLHIDGRVTPSFLWEPQPELPKGDFPLEGAYGFGRYELLPNLGGLGQMILKWRYLVFFRDGRALRWMTPEGLLSFSFDYWKPDLLNYYGSYRVNGDKVEITWELKDGKTQTQTITKAGQDYKDGAWTYSRLGRTGTKLKGRFVRVGASKEESLKQNGIVFNEDGTFTDEGILCQMATEWWCGSAYRLSDSQNKTGGKGKWRNENWTLELIYEDGRKRRFAFHSDPADTSEHPKTIICNGVVVAQLE